MQQRKGVLAFRFGRCEAKRMLRFAAQVMQCDGITGLTDLETFRVFPQPHTCDFKAREAAERALQPYLLIRVWEETEKRLRNLVVTMVVCHARKFSCSE